MRTIAGARIDRQVRVLGAHQLGGAHRGLDVVDGQHQGARLVRVGRLEDLRAAGVAVERLGAEAAHEFHLLGADVERGERNALGA